MNYAKLPLQIKPQSKIDAKTSAALDDAEDEDSDDNGTVRQGKKGDRDELENSVITPKVETNQTQRIVKNENQRQTPLFPTVVITKKKKDEVTKNNNEITRPRIVNNN